MDNIEKTIQFLKEALIEDPNNSDLRLQLASAYLNKKDTEKAQKQCELVLNIEPDNQKAKQLFDLCKGSSDAENKNYPNENTSEIIEEDAENLPLNNQHLFEKSPIMFKDVGGMEQLKEEIRLGIIYPFEKPELYLKYGKKIGGGILLYGPPGCGKTYIAKATAGEIKAMFLSIRIDDILDMWLGQSEKKIHGMFQAAREVSPTVLFIDEVDALGVDRMKITTAASSLVNQLLVEMDGIQSNNEKLMVVGATNTPWQIDPAFRRPGRFDKIIFVPPPDELARAEIFKIHLKNKPLISIDYLELAKITKGFSGADIANLCDVAVEKVMREVLSGKEERNVGMDDLLDSIKKSHQTTKEWFATAKNFARYANESGTYSPILQYMKENGLD